MSLCRLIPVALALAASTAASSATAATPVASIEDLKRVFASALAGSYPAKNCDHIGGPAEDPWSGTLNIGADGAITSPGGDVRLSMFDPRGEMGLTRRYPPYLPKTTPALFFYELKVAGDMFSIHPDKTPDHVFLETGRGHLNVDKGVSCTQVDMRGARIASPDYDMNELMLPIFDTHGATVTGQCRAGVGGKPSPSGDRSATLKLGAEGVWIDGQLLPFGDANRRIVEHGLGSRFSDGTLNGDYRWADGATVHLERFVLGYGSFDAPFANFSFHLPGMPEGSGFFCRTRAAAPGRKT